MTSAGLLALLVLLIDWGEAWSGLRNLPISVAFAATLIFAMQFVISTWKWYVSLRAMNVRVPFQFLFRVYGTGAFFSTFLPSNIGGDVYRTYRTSPYCRFPVAVAAVVLERVLGLVALLLVALLGLLWLFTRSGQISVTISVAVASLSIASYFLVPLMALHCMHGISPWMRRLPAKLSFVATAHGVLHANRGQLLQLLALCLLFQLVATGAIALLFAGIGVSWAIAESAVANGAGSIAAILPISINGLGITEASFAGVASQLGIGFTEAAMVSLLVRLLVLPLVIGFALMYVFEKRSKPMPIAVKGEVAQTMGDLAAP